MSQTFSSVSPGTPASVAGVRAFHLGWFGGVMGTTIVGVAAFMIPGSVATLQAPLRIIGIGFALLAYALAIACAFVVANRLGGDGLLC
jgi:tellurite resistance protein TehA-like permease